MFVEQAPLYLLPKTMPACLSLHNAEFQGLWPMRTREEIEEVCSVFNLPWTLVKQYVQFGEVFNLLHAGASYLRIHQQGYGAVGVSKKYGKRAFMRYPILWGLKRVQGLPNPDPRYVHRCTLRNMVVDLETVIREIGTRSYRNSQTLALILSSKSIALNGESRPKRGQV